jgi:hypothetical protein
VLFTLATSFFLPPTSVSYLTTSIELYRHAVTLTENTLLQLDAGYNLAQALLELAEVIEDLHSERVDQIRSIRNEAREMLEQVMLGQEEYIAANAEDLEMDQASEMLGQAEAAGPGEEVPVEGEGMDVDAPAATDGEGDQETSTYETHVPTPGSLVDTALLLVDTHLTLWKSLQPSSPPNEAQQIAVRSILDRAGKIVPPGRQAEVDLAEIKVLLAMDEVVWEAYKADAKAGTGVEKSLEGAVSALTTLLESLDVQPPEQPTLRAEILTTLAETHSTTAYRLLFLAPQLPPGPSPLAQAAWFNLSQAVTHWGKALDLPSSADTPKTFKPSVLLELSKASLSRAKLKDVNETAKKNAAQLIDNSLTYAIRAAESLAWGSFVKPGIGAPAAPYQGGWDMEWLARTVLLQLIRIGFVAQNDMPVTEQTKKQLEVSGRGLIKRLEGLGGDRRISAGDFQRWVEEIIDEEEGISDAEREFWQGLALASQKKA